jgi:hypothetical protein
MRGYPFDQFPIDNVDWKCVLDDVDSLVAENERLRQALELIAAPKKPDGTYNRDRETCEQVAKAALEKRK